MSTITEILLVAATVGSGIITGLCFAFATFLMRAFTHLGPTDAIRVMQSINTTILRSVAMPVWFGTAIAGIAAAFLTGGDVMTVAGATLYTVAAVGITGRGNVPLNEALDRVDPSAPDAAATWQRYDRRWGLWNWLRTILMALATAAFALARAT